MDRKVTLLAALVVGLGAFVLVSSYCLADEKAAPAPEKAPAADKTDKPAETPKATPADDGKKSDKYLGIDWGDDSGKKKPVKENPDAAAPAKKVDLATTLTEPQQKRLEAIKKQAAEGDKMAELAQSTLDGKNKNAKKDQAPKQFQAAAGIFQKGMADIESFAKGVPDQDTKLTILRDNFDGYKKRACEMLCKAGKATLDMAGDNVDNVKTAVEYYKKAYKIDPDFGDVKDGVEACRSAYKDITTRVAAKKAAEGGGGSGDKENVKSYDPNNTVKDRQGTPTDPGHTGRPKY